MRYWKMALASFLILALGLLAMAHSDQIDGVKRWARTRWGLATAHKLEALLHDDRRFRDVRVSATNFGDVGYFGKVDSEEDLEKLRKFGPERGYQGVVIFSVEVRSTGERHGVM